MSLKSFKPFKNNQTGLIWKLRIHTFQKQRAHLFCKNGVLKNFTNVTGKHLCWSLVCYEVFKNIYFEEHLQGTASGFYRPRKIDAKVPSKQTSKLVRTSI